MISGCFRSFVALCLIVGQAGVSSARGPSVEFDQRPPEILDGGQVRDLMLDILDDTEFMVGKVTELDNDAIRSIQEARSSVFEIPQADLEAFGDRAGRYLVQMRRNVREQRRIVTDLVRYNEDGTVPDYIVEMMERRSSPAMTVNSVGFPALRDFGRGSGIADYPNADIAPQSGTGTSEDEYESQEGDEETREANHCAEAESEDEADVISCSWDGTFCSGDCPGDQFTMDGEAVNGPGAVCNTGPLNPTIGTFRATRDGAGTIFTELLLLNINRTLAAIAGRFCDQDIAGFSCSLCCIPVDLLIGVQETLFDIISECRDLTDGAEIEMTYHNTLSTYQGVEHVHGDLSTHDSALANHNNALTGHNTALTNHNTALVNHDTALTNHNTALTNHDAALGTHDTDIKNRLNDLDGQVTAVQTTLDNEIEKQRVKINLIQLSNMREFLISTTEAGAPVDVTFTKLTTARHSTLAFADILAAVTIAQIDTGLYRLTIPSGVGEDVYQLAVRHDGAVDHFGHLLFHRVVSNNISSP